MGNAEGDARLSEGLNKCILRILFNWKVSGCWVCRCPFSDTKQASTDLQMECGHKVCEGCAVSLCTQSFLSQHCKGKQSLTPEGNQEPPIDIECGFCHHVTTDAIAVMDVVDAICRDVSTVGSASNTTAGRCIVHPGQELNLYCKDDKVLVCPQCEKELHQFHKLIGIEQQAEIAVKKVPALRRSIQKEKDLMKQAALRIEEIIEAITSNQKTAEAEIENTFDKLMKQLLRKKATLLATTAKTFQKKKQSLQRQLKITRFAVSQLTDLEFKLTDTTDKTVSADLSLVALTSQPILCNWKKSVKTRIYDEFLFPWGTLIDSQLHLDQGCVAPVLNLIDNLGISKSGEDEIGLSAIRYLSQGNLEQAFKICMAMVSPSNGRPFAIRSHKPAPKLEESTTTENKLEKLGSTLLKIIFTVKPKLFSNMEPFDVYPTVYFEEKLKECSLESSHFMTHITEHILSRDGTYCGRILATDDDLFVALAHYLRFDSPEQQKELSQAETLCLLYDTTCTCGNQEQPQHNGSGSSLIHVLCGISGSKGDKCVLEWLEPAAQYGIPAIQSILGILLLVGEEEQSKREPVAGMEWIKKGAEAGDAFGQSVMFILHCAEYFPNVMSVVENLEAAGFKRDPATGRRWLQLSANQGFPLAQVILGQVLEIENGNKIEAPKESKRLFHLADQQDSISQEISGTREFQAHEQEVKCLAIGKGSCKVFATASVDTKPDIGVWRLDQSTPGTSLSGKNKPTTGSVTCVAFDPLEEVLMAGLNNGTVLLWDISSQEISRVLTHKARCTATDINPMDEWMCATTGDDSCITLWDIRASENIETFKAHSGPIGVCRFTPDGVFLVSGGSDGVVALWDIAQRRLFQTLSDHTAPITCMCFHPHEVLLATGSADKSARFWDLETYTQISFTSGPSCVQALTFAPDGHSAVVAFNDSLRVCSWEPMEIKATIQANWTHSHPHRSPLDLCIVKEHIIACTANGSMVTVWSTPIHKVCDMDMTAAEDMSHTNEVLEKVAGPRNLDSIQA
ncbi:WD40 repeat [Pelomyxa schiedti]|nr:WD40 repeat [Pelomyxa schiedti]